jgi:uncharacterized protein YbaP (TraB family)
VGVLSAAFRFVHNATVGGALVAVFGVAGVAAAATANVPFSQGLLFRVDKPGVPPSYVFGTLHSNDARVSTPPDLALRALESSRRLAPEILLSDADLPAFFESAQYADQRRLADSFDAPTIARLYAALGAEAPAREAFERLKPWAVLLLLAQPQIGTPGPTLDRVLVAEAHRRRITVIGLELPDEQIASLDAIPLASQVALVHWALERRAALVADHEAAIAAWLARDLARLHALALAPGLAEPALAPHLSELMRHLIDNRSVVMAHRLFLPLREGRVFVAVGALHLFGANGMLALIREQGYRVQRVWRVRRRTRVPGAVESQLRIRSPPRRRIPSR